MKVILLQDVKKQGKKDDILEVSEGYAKNFLINKGLAVPYNVQNKNKLDRQIKQREDDEEELIKECNEIKNKLQDKNLKFKVKVAKDGRMFGSISMKQISDEIKKLGFDIDKRKIECDHPIDCLGVHKVVVKLHKKVEFTVNVCVE